MEENLQPTDHHGAYRISNTAHRACESLDDVVGRQTKPVRNQELGHDPCGFGIIGWKDGASCRVSNQDRDQPCDQARKHGKTHGLLGTDFDLIVLACTKEAADNGRARRSNRHGQREHEEQHVDASTLRG